MEFITLLLSGHLILIFVTAFSPDENLSTEFGTVTDKPLDDFNLSDDILPTYYDIELVLDIEKDIFYGSCNISIKILKDIRNIIRLHSANLNITDSTLFIEHFEQKLHNITYINRHEIVNLDFDMNLLSIFNYTLHVTFTGIISNTGGLFKTSYINKEGHREWLIATHNSGIGTRRLFPCWDEPRFKANFSISLKHYDNYTAFSNMPTVSSWSETEDITVTRFATTPPIPTHLIAILLIRFSKSSFYSIGHYLWSKFQAIKYSIYADSIMKNVIETFENEQPYTKKYLNEHHFSIPGWLEDGMDKWHIVFYSEASIIYNDEIDPIARKIEISRLIARKVAGQWIGSAINSSQWSHMWLHESISTLLGINVLNEIIPDYRMMDLFVVQTLQESLRLDNTFINNTFMNNNTFMKSLTSEVNNISEINSLFSFAYYLKGPVVLRMLQYALGNKVFQEGINTYLKMQLSSLDSFWTIMQAAYDKIHETTISILNIKEVMDSWLKKNYYPILNVERIEDREIFKVSAQTAHENWWIPVTYNTSQTITLGITLPIWLRTHSSSSSKTKIFTYITVPNFKTDWIILNLQQTGYYRVNYYTENWLAIADYLSSKNYINVHVLNRAQIIDDAFYFMITDQLEPYIFWKVTNFLSQESDYIVWYPMFKAIEYMSCSYPFHENQALKANILNLLDSLLDKIGYEEYSEDNLLTKCLRQEAAKWACVLGDDECQSKAKAQLSRHLSNLKTNYFFPWWKEWIYCHGLSTADVTLINKVYETYSSGKNNTKALELLSCSNNYSHVLSLLKVVKSFSLASRKTRGPMYTIITKGYIKMFHYIVQRHAKNEETLQYILSNWKEIKPKEISSIAALIDIINHVYSPNHLYKIKEFMKNVEEGTSVIAVLNHVFELYLELLNMPILYLHMLDEIIKEIYHKVLFPGIQNKINIRFSQINRHKKSFVFNV